MDKRWNEGALLLFIAGILGIGTNILLMVPGVSTGMWELNFITASTIVISVMLIVFSFSIMAKKNVRIFSVVAFILSLLLLISLYEWLVGILGIIGSVVSFERREKAKRVETRAKRVVVKKRKAVARKRKKRR